MTIAHLDPCLPALPEVYPELVEGQGRRRSGQQGEGRLAKGGWVYIMTNGAHGTLYIGVTSNLAARVTQHREGRGSEFCARYGLTRLVHAERHDDIRDAIVREKAMKKWKRQW